MSTSATDTSPPATSPTGGPSAAAITGALADDLRRRVFAAVQLGAATLDAVASAAGVTSAQAGKALGKLAEVGVVAATGGSLTVPPGVFQQAAREALARPARAEHDDQPAEARRVLDHFVVGGRLESIPTARTKRLVVLNWLAQRFEPGRRYSEAVVNATLAEYHPDTAALRRYLVDDDFLTREAGEYWRSGGTIAG